MHYGIKEYKKQQMLSWMRDSNNIIAWDWVMAWVVGAAVSVAAILLARMPV